MTQSRLAEAAEAEAHVGVDPDKLDTSAAVDGLLPNLIIAGAPKSGTSSVFKWLSDHPQVVGSAVKETYYFVDPGTHMFEETSHYLSGGLGGYRKYFPKSKKAPTVVVEATPSYIYSELALAQLPRIPTRPHFLFLLREPVSQLHSTFRYFQSNWDWIPAECDFAQFLDACQSGTADFKGNELAIHALRNAEYAVHLKRWQLACGRDRLHVFLFEEAFADKRRFMRHVAGLFGIAAEFYDTYDFPSENETYSVRSNAVQKLNIRLRSLIPRGALYSAARSVYRRLNTRIVPADIQLSGEWERQLAERYGPANDLLKKEFGLDLSVWEQIGKARRSAARSGADGSI